jgi:hypothetical protein
MSWDIRDISIHHQPTDPGTLINSLPRPEIEQDRAPHARVPDVASCNYSALRAALHSGAVVHAHAWSRWDRCKFAIAFVSLGLVLGMAITAYINYRIPLSPAPVPMER